MAGDFFLWALAGATATAAIALLALLFRRPRRGAPTPARPPGTGARRPATAEDDAARDGEPEPAWTDPPFEGEGELAKICPACGLRYGLSSRTCERDNSELAAIN